MKKIVLAVGVVAIVLTGWFFLSGSTVEFVTTVQDEVTALEIELTEIDAAVQAEMLPAAEAIEAQTKIIARLDAINAAVASGAGVALTPSQRLLLNRGLEQLMQTLVRFQDTLVVLDETVAALPESEKPTPQQGDEERRSVVVALTETVATVAEVVDGLPADGESEPFSDKVAPTSDEGNGVGPTSTEAISDGGGNSEEGVLLGEIPLNDDLGNDDNTDESDKTSTSGPFDSETDLIEESENTMASSS